MELQGFPGGPVVRNPAANARDTDVFDPWSWKIPHVEGQLSPCATAIERVLQSLGDATTEPTC